MNLGPNYGIDTTTGLRRYAKTLDELRWRFQDYHTGKILEQNERMRRFAIRYAKRFKRQCGAYPHGHQPFPSPWHPTFLIEYCGPSGYIDEEYARWMAVHGINGGDAVT